MTSTPNSIKEMARQVLYASAAKTDSTHRRISRHKYRAHSLRIDQSISAYRTRSGHLFLIDCDNEPISAANYYLSTLQLRRCCVNTTDKAAYILRRWFNTARHQGFDPLNPKNSDFSSYIRTNYACLGTSTFLQAATTLHSFFTMMVVEKRATKLPYAVRSNRSHYSRKFNDMMPDFLPRVRRSTIVLPPLEHFSVFLNQLPAPYDLIAQIMISTGARVTEALQVPEVWRSRVHLEDRHYLVYVKRKGGHQGALVVDPDLASRIHAALTRRPRLLSSRSRPLTRKSVAAAFAKTSATSPSPITAHMLRHAFASWLYAELARTSRRRGAKLSLDPLLGVAIALDHRSPNTTANIYIHRFVLADPKPQVAARKGTARILTRYFTQPNSFATNPQHTRRNAA